MHIIVLVILFIFLVMLIFMTIYGFLNVREIKLAKIDLGLTLPRKVETWVDISLWISFISVGILLALLIYEIFQTTG